MQVFIYATEGMYQGLHGIYWQGVVEVDSREEADDWGREEAYELIESFGLEDEYDESSFDYEGECNWLVHKIRDDIHMDTHELDSICADLDYESFIEDYCDKEEWLG